MSDKERSQDAPENTDAAKKLYEKPEIRKYEPLPKVGLGMSASTSMEE